jgi:hypothetical protein
VTATVIPFPPPGSARSPVLLPTPIAAGSEATRPKNRRFGQDLRAFKESVDKVSATERNKWIR